MISLGLVEPPKEDKPKPLMPTQLLVLAAQRTQPAAALQKHFQEQDRPESDKSSATKGDAGESHFRGRAAAAPPTTGNSSARASDGAASGDTDGARDATAPTGDGGAAGTAASY